MLSHSVGGWIRPIAKLDGRVFADHRPRASPSSAGRTPQAITLQRHFRVLTKFAHVESRLSGRKRQRKVVFYTPINLCDRRPCSTSVAVGLLAPLTFRSLL